MQEISKELVVARIRMENPWWGEMQAIPAHYKNLTHRAQFAHFLEGVKNHSLRRALILMGQRRIGKTVMIHHAIQKLLDEGTDPRKIAYISLDRPLYTGLGLEELFSIFREAVGYAQPGGFILFYDEIQYLRDWERHLKVMVDTYPGVKCVVSGSAAAALRMKSVESGAGRFTDFRLLPLTFMEYLQLRGRTDLTATLTWGIKSSVGEHPDEAIRKTLKEIEPDEINAEFVNFINYGGFPELLKIDSPSQIQQAIGHDIIEKVLLRDLPSLYGIGDTQELNRLFNYLAWNTGNEVSIEGLSQKSGISKNTLKKYLAYFEAAFLVKCSRRVDENARHFHREVAFKIHLMNTAMRAALFGPLSDGDPTMGHVVESAIFLELSEAGMPAHYARWDRGAGEVDLVLMDRLEQKPIYACEIKWSDHTKPSELMALAGFCKKHGIETAVATSRTRSEMLVVEGVQVQMVPASIFCAYWLMAFLKRHAGKK